MTKEEDPITIERYQAIYGYAQGIRNSLDELETNLKQNNIWDTKENHKSIKISVDRILSLLFQLTDDRGIKIQTFPYKKQTSKGNDKP